MNLYILYIVSDTKTSVFYNSPKSQLFMRPDKMIILASSNIPGNAVSILSSGEPSLILYLFLCFIIDFLSVNNSFMSLDVI